jgi:hypothetical protein
MFPENSVEPIGAVSRANIASVGPLQRPRLQFNLSATVFHRLGFKGSAKASTAFDEAEQAIAAGWELIGLVKTGHLGDGGVHASSLHRSTGDLGPYRYLLWVTEDTVRGTFITEIDIHLAGEAAVDL